MRTAGSVAALLTVAMWTAGCGGGAAALEAQGQAIVLRDFQPADVVFGQPIFAFGEPNQGRPTPGAETLRGGGKAGGGGLYIPDVDNNRVLGLTATPIISNLSARFVLGQPGFQFDFAGVGSTAMDRPVAADVHGDELYVADQGNHRILVWRGLPHGNGASADVALGQPDLFSKTPSGGAAGLNAPAGISIGNGVIAVADTGNHRVLAWLETPPASGAAADRVIGQGDFDSTLPNRGAPAIDPTTLNAPTAVWTDGTRLVVADRGNHRVLIWNSLPAVPGVPADLVLGQLDFVSAAPAGGPVGMNRPSDVCSNGMQLFVADAGNHRILVWDNFPTASHRAPDRVLGQSDFFHDAPNDADQDGVEDAQPSARTLKSLDGMLHVHVSGNQLFVGDAGNHRLLIFDSR